MASGGTSEFDELARLREENKRLKRQTKDLSRAARDFNVSYSKQNLIVKDLERKLNTLEIRQFDMKHTEKLCKEFEERSLSYAQENTVLKSQLRDLRTELEEVKADLEKEKTRCEGKEESINFYKACLINESGGQKDDGEEISCKDFTRKLSLLEEKVLEDEEISCEDFTKKLSLLEGKVLEGKNIIYLFKKEIQGLTDENKKLTDEKSIVEEENKNLGRLHAQVDAHNANLKTELRRSERKYECHVKMIRTLCDQNPDIKEKVRKFDNASMHGSSNENMLHIGVKRKHYHGSSVYVSDIAMIRELCEHNRHSEEGIKRFNNENMHIGAERSHDSRVKVEDGKSIISGDVMYMEVANNVQVKDAEPSLANGKSDLDNKSAKIN